MGAHKRLPFPQMEHLQKGCCKWRVIGQVSMDAIWSRKSLAKSHTIGWMMREVSGLKSTITRNSRVKDRMTNIVIVAYDFGIKENILRHLSSFGANLLVVPADTTAGDVLAMKPDGVFLSNGPGDPAGLPYAVDAVSWLIASGVPMFGICLGHQLIGRALGAETHRLKFGHHGGNHPVQYLPSGEVLITAQNHNYCVAEGDLNPEEVEITYKSLNDDSLEGLAHEKQTGVERPIPSRSRAGSA